MVTVSAVAIQAKRVPNHFPTAMYIDCPAMLSRRRNIATNRIDIMKLIPKPVYSPSGSLNSRNARYTTGKAMAIATTTMSLKYLRTSGAAKSLAPYLNTCQAMTKSMKKQGMLNM